MSLPQVRLTTRRILIITRADVPGSVAQFQPLEKIMDKMLELVRLIASAIVGGMVATFCTHFLTKERERMRDSTTRRRQFFAFLDQWQAEFVRIPHNDHRALFAHYTTRAPSFCAEVARCDGDFSDAHNDTRVVMTNFAPRLEP